MSVPVRRVNQRGRPTRTAYAREQLADDEIARFGDHLSGRIRELAGQT